MILLLRRWATSLTALIVGAILCAVQYREPGTVAIIAGAALIIAVIASPLVFPRRRTAPGADEPARPIIYWRPGCPYCLRLRLALGPLAGRATWIDIWADRDAAATLRGVAGGNETVPTLVTSTEAIVNPAPTVARQLLRAAG